MGPSRVWLWMLVLLPLSVQGQQRGKLDIFCPAPAVYGGSRSEVEVSQAVQTKLIYFAKCYKTHFQRGAPPVFKLRFRFQAKRSGMITNIQCIHEGTKNRAFIDCIAGILAQTLLKPAEDGQDCTVEQSIIFRIL